MQKYSYISVDNILAKYHRDFRGLDVHESDAIEWIGEALGFMKIPSAQEERIAFMEVKNHQAVLPNGLHYIIGIARDNHWVKTDPTTCPSEVATALAEVAAITDPCTNTDACGNVIDCIPVDCYGRPLDKDFTYYTPYFDLQGEYYGWCSTNYYQEKYTPVRLANHSFFNSLVCQDPDMSDVYRNQSCHDEYTIIEQSVLRFSFKEGYVAVAYLGQKVDDKGYPMIPDNEYARNAVTYYMAWKTKQRESYLHREGALALSREAQLQWNSYIKKFKNNAKMPTGVDQFQNLMEQSRYLIPRFNRYYGFFGKLGRAEQRPFNDPRSNLNLYIGNR
jgi:hypothetical protein